MTTITRFIGYTSAAAVACALTITNVATAQTTSNKRVAQAVALESKADGLRGVPAKWSALAGALEHAASLRGAKDLEAVKDLMYAATIRAQLGDALRAQSEYVQAAEQALAMGDVPTAANGYIRAAMLAARLKDAPYALNLRDKAANLAQSPLLNESQRAEILGHVGNVIGTGS